MKNKNVLLAIVGTLLVVSVAGVGAWQFSPDLFGLCKEDLVDTPSEEISLAEVPSDFEEDEVNGVKLYYPDSWRRPDKEKTKEDFSEEYPFYTYKGEQMTFDDWEQSVYVLNESSYKKDKNLKDTLSLLEEVYENRFVTAEEVYSLEYPYLPPPGANVNFANPKYIESQNGSWRGYWFVANTTQDVSIAVNLVGVVYSQDEGKIITINQYIETDDTKDIQDEMLGITEDWEFQSISYDIDQYLKTAYHKDKELKEIVDEEFLLVLKYLQ